MIGSSPRSDFRSRDLCVHRFLLLVFCPSRSFCVSFVFPGSFRWFLRFIWSLPGSILLNFVSFFHFCLDLCVPPFHSLLSRSFSRSPVLRFVGRLRLVLCVFVIFVSRSSFSFGLRFHCCVFLVILVRISTLFCTSMVSFLLGLLYLRFLVFSVLFLGFLLWFSPTCTASLYSHHKLWFSRGCLCSGSSYSRFSLLWIRRFFLASRFTFTDRSFHVFWIVFTIFSFSFCYISF